MDASMLQMELESINMKSFVRHKYLEALASVAVSSAPDTDANVAGHGKLYNLRHILTMR